MEDLVHFSMSNDRALQCPDPRSSIMDKSDIDGISYIAKSECKTRARLPYNNLILSIMVSGTIRSKAYISQCVGFLAYRFGILALTLLYIYIYIYM